jgi:hypothetical protein
LIENQGYLAAETLNSFGQGTWDMPTAWTFKEIGEVCTKESLLYRKRFQRGHTTTPIKKSRIPSHLDINQYWARNLGYAHMDIHRDCIKPYKPWQAPHL